ncbi:MAG: hypothetical protein GWN00_28770 [Aliifodinibius sp.]|nr:SGNH/GDSL hydrolase family protein [Fodinibius sp.]NIY28650.1 hypothetical protein [Fodinibius sp.]
MKLSDLAHLIKKINYSSLSKIILFLSLSLLCVELTYRIYLFGINAFNYEKVNSMAVFTRTGFVRASEYPGVLYELKPNLRSHFKMAKFETNSQGLCDKEYQIKTDPGITRIVIIGSSFSMGSGVEIDEIYHSILEERLNSGLSGKRYEVINFAVAGYNLDMMLATLRYKALGYEPDLVVVSLTPFTHTSFFTLEKYHQPYQVHEKVNPFFRSFIYDTLLYPRLNTRRFKYKVTETDEIEARTRKVFRELYELSKEHNFKVVTLGLNKDPLKRDPYDLEKRLSKSYGFHFIDTKSFFINYDPSALAISKTDGHPNALAHSLFAEALYEGLSEFNLLNIGHGTY